MLIDVLLFEPRRFAAYGNTLKTIWTYCT